VAPDGLVLHLHVGVEGDEGAIGEPGEGVDLGERHVVVALKLREAGEDRGGAGELAPGHADGGHDLLRAEVRDGLEIGEMAAADVIGMVLGDLLDVDPAHVRKEHHRALGASVPEHRGVVLLLDLGLGVHEDADRHVPVDLELEDLLGVPLRLLRRVGELDPARLHPAPGQDLRLDHGGAPDPLGGLARLGGGLGEPVLGDRDPGPLDYAAAFELVEAHGRSRGTGGNPTKPPLRVRWGGL
jgi:hypothetical protein